MLHWNKNWYSATAAGTTNNPLLQSQIQIKTFLLSQNNAVFHIMPFTILQVVEDLKVIYLRGRHFLEFYYWGPKWLYTNTGKFTQHVFQGFII